MKFTEGAFRNWGYELAEREFAGETYTWDQWERTKKAAGARPLPTPSRRRRSLPVRSSSRTRSPTSRSSRS